MAKLKTQFNDLVSAPEAPTPTPPLFSEVVEVEAVSGNNDLTLYNGKIVKMIGIEIVFGTFTLTLPTNIQVWFTGVEESISALNFIVGTQYNNFVSYWFNDGGITSSIVGGDVSGRIDFSYSPNYTNNLVVKIGGSVNVYSQGEI
jgi:hypothetical protein